MALRAGPTRADVAVLAAILALTRAQQGRPPTLDEVTRALGFRGSSSKGNLHRQLLRLRPTYVMWDRTARSLALTAIGKDWVMGAERIDEDEDKEGMMRTQHTGAHPSDRLLHGPVSGFEEALELAMQAQILERQLGRAEPEEAAIVRAEVALAQVRAATRHAGQVYRQEQEAARRRTVDRLRADALAAEAALDDEAARWLGLLAQALEVGDYSGLAI